MRIPEPAVTHARSTVNHSGPFPFRSIAAFAHVVLGALVFLAFPVSTTHAQWQSFDRQGENFRALAVSDSLVYALSSPYAIHASESHGLTWYTFDCRVSVACEGFSVGILDGTRIGGSSDGKFVRGSGSTSNVRQAVVGVTDDILAVISTRRGTLSTWYLGGFGGGVRRSTDEGNTWALCNEGLTDLNVTSLVTIAAPGDTSQVLFAGTYGGGVFRSDDDGLHWTSSSAGLEDPHVYALIAHGDTLYTAHSGGRVSRSANAGSTWSTLGTGLPYTDVLCLTQVSSDEGRLIFAGTIDRGVWRYAPSDGTWQPVNTGSTSMRINAIIAHDDVLIFGTDRGLYRSTDRGSSWHAADSGAIPNVNAIQATSTSRGAPGTRIFTVSDAHYSLIEAYRGVTSVCSRVSWTDDFGSTWTTVPFYPNYINAGYHFSSFATVRDDCILLVSARSVDTDNFRGILSTDRGTSWGDMIPMYPPTNCALSGVTMHDVPLEHRLDLYFTAAGGPTPGMFRSLDSGKTWSIVKYPAGGPIMGPLLATDSVIYAACQTSALVSSNSGATWTPITYDGVYLYHTPPGTLYSLPMLSLLHANGPLLYASVAPDIVPGDPGGLCISSDRGATWTHAGLPGHSVGRVVECDSVLFALQNGHVFASRADSLRWTDVSGELSIDSIVVISASPEYLVALTEASDRIWYRPMAEVKAILHGTPVHVPLSTPAAFALLQNYPNPFNPTTRIGYQIPVSGHVKLAVFDLLGREVAVLVDEKKTAGRYEVRFDGAGLSSGVYIYRIRVQHPEAVPSGRPGNRDITEARTLILLR